MTTTTKPDEEKSQRKNATKEKRNGNRQVQMQQYIQVQMQRYIQVYSLSPLDSMPQIDHLGL